MILPSDNDYQEAKHLKRNNSALQPPFRELAAWLSAEYRINVINLYYDKIIPDKRPRLTVILESNSDERRFRDSELGNYNRIDQDRIGRRFSKIVAERQDDRFNTDGLLVIFAAFEPVARVEANESVTEAELESLKLRLNNKDLWKISRLFGGVTFFFFTDAQVKKYEAAGLRERYAQEYAPLVEPHDEFGYISKRNVAVYFDSKENFDANYSGNWYHYYK